MDDVLKAVTTYMVAFAGFTADLEMTSVLATALVVARLVQELPKAIAALRNFRKRATKDDDE